MRCVGGGGDSLCEVQKSNSPFGIKDTTDVVPFTAEQAAIWKGQLTAYLKRPREETLALRRKRLKQTPFAYSQHGLVPGHVLVQLELLDIDPDLGKHICFGGGGFSSCVFF
jgi:hypothetical protein